jgi:aspartyl-tRNA(Asn)/glutamyl-tRNA(Gln) amidotransferase subunit C
MPIIQKPNSMKIDKSTVENIAHLARLELSESEKDKMVDDLSKILVWMEQLNEVDTENIEPLTHMSEAVNVFREDIANNQLSRERALFNAPQKDDTYFMVPKVIE